MPPVFVDTNIPMYAAGTPHPLKAPSQRILRAIANGELQAVTDAEVLQEILYRYLHIGQKEKGLKIFDSFRRIMLGYILPVEDLDVQLAREFVERYSFLSPRDLIHLAVMWRHNVREIVTADTGFDLVEGIRRINPLEFS